MIRTLEKGIRGINNVLNCIGMVLLMGLMFLGAADVVGRYFFNMPIKGAYEYSEILLAGVVFFGLAYTASVKGHVTVDTFFTKFSPRVQALVGVIINFIAIAVFALMAWQGALKALRSWESHRMIDVILLPIAPFQLFVTIGALALCFELLIQLLHSLRNMK